MAFEGYMAVRETPWEGLGYQFDTKSAVSGQLVKEAGLDWEVAAAKMYTEEHGVIGNYHTIYRTDRTGTDGILGVINKRNPVLVQNTDAFLSFEGMMESGVLDIETASFLGQGENIFGVFKINNAYKMLDDDVDMYFVVYNNHLAGDGKVTVFNSPIRVVCQNQLSQLLHNNNQKMRVAVSFDSGVRAKTMSRLQTYYSNAVLDLQNRAEALYKQKISREQVEILLDELFPYVNAEDPESIHSKANLRVEMARDSFIADCMGADDLSNYRGTALQVMNALVDWDGHYFANVDKAYDLNFRMNRGFGTSPEGAITKKGMAVLKRLTV